MSHQHRHQPIDPLRMRIYSELNLQLSQHGIEKDMLHETSKHLAFLTRYYLTTPHPDPLRISVPIISIPLIPGRQDVMGHKIALVVHSAPSPTATIPGDVKDVKEEGAPRLHVLIENRGALGHYKCLIGGLAAIAERVIGGLVAGEEDMLEVLEKKVKGMGPVWDVLPWGDYC